MERTSTPTPTLPATLLAGVREPRRCSHVAARLPRAYDL
jgi:hypothetical protein